METFPTSLPNPIVEGFSENPVDTRIVDENDMGINEFRQVTTARIKTIRFSMVLTQDEKDTLEDFYYDTVKEVLPFLMQHPKTKVVGEYQFVNPPSDATQFSPATWLVRITVRES